jgi:hypothetical protein
MSMTITPAITPQQSQGLPSALEIALLRKSAADVANTYSSLVKDRKALESGGQPVDENGFFQKVSGLSQLQGNTEQAISQLENRFGTDEKIKKIVQELRNTLNGKPELNETASPNPNQAQSKQAEKAPTPKTAQPSPLQTQTKAPVKSNPTPQAQDTTRANQVNSPAPLGLYNAGCNCWINSLFQMIYADPSTKEWLLSNDCPKELLPFKTFIQAYDAASKNGGPQPSSQSLRVCLSTLTHNAIKTNVFKQEDPTEAWMAINELRPKNLRLQAEETRQYTPRANEPALLAGEEMRSDPRELDLTLTIEGENPSLATLMDNHCYEARTQGHLDLKTSTGKTHRYTDLTFIKQTRATSAPPSLHIQLKQFDPHGKKIPVQIPEHYDLKLRDGTRAGYELNSFLCHEGGRDGGHYISFRRGDDGQWYMFDDSSVRKVSKTEMSRYLQKAYFVQYSKKPKA